MPKAIYEGIYREIRSRIINGTYAFQEMLPTEAELTAEFGCTRNTVRRALGMLADGDVCAAHTRQGRARHLA